MFLPMVCSLFYILSKYMYMLCNTHNLEMNKMLYSWFVNLFLHERENMSGAGEGRVEEERAS